jgi:shikimate kinase
LERPLLTKIPDEALQEYIAVHLFERSNYYHKADLYISIDDKNMENIVDEIVDKIK